MAQVRTVVPPDAEFDLYVIKRGSKAKPKRVGTYPADRVVPNEMEIEGKTHYFYSANLSERWLAYGDSQRPA